LSDIPASVLYIGLMSGTSADGIDGVVAEWQASKRPRVLAHVHLPFESALRDRLLQLNQPGPDELARAAEAASALARCYADVSRQLLTQAQLEPGQVRAIGAHGQTVRHRPGPVKHAADPDALIDETGYTVQLLNGALLAELSGIDVVCDFRSRDVAAGGQGAPLVPAVHQALFSRADTDVGVLNLGGIANLSLLPSLPRQQAGAPVLGFDTGPANALMDLWCERHGRGRYDAQGRWAASGQVQQALLDVFRQEPFFAQPAPKSTGRDTFNGAWLDRCLAQASSQIRADAPWAPQDVQATLAELTAQTVAEAVRQYSPQCSELIACGGGARNTHLLQRLKQHLPSAVSVKCTDALGIPVDQVEALAFAWLARARMERRPGNLPAVTGAQGLRVLGAVHAR
jgi:anhydro-N-acetylmuramic acid kinase